MVYLCKYRKKGSSHGFERLFAAPNYAAAFNYIMIAHAQDKLSIRATDLLKVEAISEVHDA